MPDGTTNTSSYTSGVGDAENDSIVTTPDTSFFGDLFGNVDLSNLDFGKIVGGLGDLFKGTSSAGAGGQIAGLAGIAALLNKISPQAGPQFSGYKGGIPTYTAERSQLPIPTTMPNPAYAAGQTTTAPQTLPRRPGAGGITYFTPTTYKAAGGGISSLGDYSDGGRLLRGPGDGVSDSIPARIGKKQEARLADGEFVVPARIVSELGNGSTEAGARKLYAMMDRVKKARSKSMKNIAADSKAEKMLPA